MARKTALCFLTPPQWPQTVRAYGKTIHVHGRWHFLVDSKSEDGCHVVDLEPVEDWPSGGCTCRGFTTRKQCSHFDAVAKLVGLDRLIR